MHLDVVTNRSNASQGEIQIQNGYNVKIEENEDVRHAQSFYSPHARPSFERAGTFRQAAPGPTSYTSPVVALLNAQIEPQTAMAVVTTSSPTSVHPHLRSPPMSATLAHSGPMTHIMNENVAPSTAMTDANSGTRTDTETAASASAMRSNATRTTLTRCETVRVAPAATSKAPSIPSRISMVTLSCSVDGQTLDPMRGEETPRTGLAVRAYFDSGVTTRPQSAILFIEGWTLYSIRSRLNCRDVSGAVARIEQRWSSPHR